MLRYSFMARTYFVPAALALTVAACAPPHSDTPDSPQLRRLGGMPMVVADTVVASTVAIHGTAHPIASATLSTRVISSVTEVLAQEGTQVAAGTILLRTDTRELEAKRAQLLAALGTALAAEGEAKLMAERLRALYADSAAPKVQLDAAEAALLRGSAAVDGARAALLELDAMESYAMLRAPFSGTVTRRYADPGILASPGVPLLTVEDHSTLRVTATATAATAASLRPGERVEVTIEGITAVGRVEGTVPSGGNGMMSVNVLVPNPDGLLPSGGVATAHLTGPDTPVLLVPEGALLRERDLTGVVVRSNGEEQIRWITVGARVGSMRMVLSGLKGGDTVLVRPDQREE